MNNQLLFYDENIFFRIQILINVILYNLIYFIFKYKRTKNKFCFFLLNFFFVLKCRNGILDGTHPVTYDEAIQFAGLQSQIQYGDYQESKHKPNILE
jgi:hypothetical protein